MSWAGAVPPPMFISPRLMAALKIEGVGQLEVGSGGSWCIQDVNGEVLEEGTDLHSPLATDWGEPMRALLSFLGAAGEAYGCAARNSSAEPENLALFNERVTEWAYQHSEELVLAEYGLTELSEVHS